MYQAMPVCGKLGGSFVFSAANDGQQNSRLFVYDKISGFRFLVDSGAAVSCFPQRLSPESSPAELTLWAANGSRIRTFGSKTFELKFNVEKKFPWSFLVAEVSHPIIGADFLRHFGLLVDVKNNCLLDKSTNLVAKGLVSPGPTFGLTMVSSHTPFAEIISKYPQLTNPVLNQNPKPHSVTHWIETRGPPVYSPARRLSPEKLLAVKKEFGELLRQGIIRPSKSQWASAIHLVPKKPTGYRICGDFRRINHVTIPDRYPVPHIQDFTHTLSGRSIFSKIDLVKAYHQIPVEPQDIPKTAVITPIGLYEYTCMTFGLRNAAQTFQRFIDEVLRNLECCVSYIDDIIVASDSEEQHKADLERVFQRLVEYGLVVNLDKCVFGKEKINFLGFLVSKDGIEPLPEKVKALLEFPLPKTIEELRRFLAMTNFYHRFMKGAAKMQASLHSLAKGEGKRKKKDKSVIDWTEEARSAFQACRDAISKAALLAHPVPGAPLNLVVDASDFAVGGVLQQVVNGQVQPLGFFSRKLINAEMRYSCYDRELLAIYSAVKYFRHMIEGRECVVYTDHKPLTFAFQQKGDKQSPRQIRHLEFISQFTTSIKFVPGVQNTVADSFSRICELDLSNSGGVDYDLLAAAQSRDGALRSLLDTDSGLELRLVNLGSSKVYCDISTGHLRPYVPNNFQKSIFQFLHGLSHPGARATLDLIRKRFVWPSMSKDVKLWCKNCIDCQKSKIQRHTVTPTGSFGLPSARFAHVHLDIVGPLPPSKGFVYALTCVDRFTRWPEVFPMTDQTANTVADTFYSGWVARFGVPETILTDQGRQFESDLFTSLAKFLGITKTRTTAYNPKCNGAVERFHRHLKSSIMCHATERWVEVLPTVLLGIRSSLKQDIGATTADLVYGCSIRLPGEFLQASSGATAQLSRKDLLGELWRKMRELRPVPAANHAAKSSVFVSKDLAHTTHVFVRVDAVRRPLQQPFNGPYPVIKRAAKFYTILINNKDVCVSLDRLKPAFLFNDSEDSSSSFSPSPVPEAIPSSSAPLQSALRKETTTRSGRRVRFVVPFQAQA